MIGTEDNGLLSLTDGTRRREVWSSADPPAERAQMIIREFLGLFSRYMTSPANNPE